LIERLDMDGLFEIRYGMNERLKMDWDWIEGRIWIDWEIRYGLRIDWRLDGLIERLGLDMEWMRDWDWLKVEGWRLIYWDWRWIDWD
jgi:hypothetical protein